MSDLELGSIKSKAEAISEEFQTQKELLSQNPIEQNIEELRIAFLGRKGKVTGLMELMRSVDKQSRPEAGKLINTVRKQIESDLGTLQGLAAERLLDEKLNENHIDITLPVSPELGQGSLHPVTLMTRVMLKEFRNLGFTVYDGPEVDLDLYNFSSLNFQDDHPARDMQDTFFVKDYEKTVLRTQTSNVQIHAMLNEKPPMRIVAPGRTYRCDSDLTHTPMFHQIEGFVVDQNISMADMKGVVDRFLKAIFGKNLETRLRPSYFPFVEPGGEVDMECVACSGKGCRICSHTGWLEIGGLGMIHPNVFEAVDLDSERYTGFAFGFGIDRIAMLRYGLKDLRQLFEGHRSFLQQFPVYP